MHERFVSLALTLLVACVALITAYRLGYFSWKREGNFAKLSISDVIGAFVSFILIQLVIAPALMTVYFSFVKKMSLDEMRHLNYQTDAWLGIINNVMLFIGFAIYCYFKRDKVKTFFGKRLMFRDFMMGIVTWIICMPIASFLGELIEFFLNFIREKAVDQTAVLHLKQAALYPGLFIATAIVVITIVPILEELLFRGFLQTWMREQIGIKWAIIITSMIFALFHFSLKQSYDNILILGILFVVSWFMGYVYERQKSLLAPIGLHAMFNAVTTFSIFFTS